MKFIITGKWKNAYEYDGILYAVQRMEEMLNGYTSHIYKVPVYNTYLLAIEYLSTYMQVESGTIDGNHLKIILEEFIDSFSSDVVVRKHFTNSDIKYYVGKIKGCSGILQKRIIEYIFQILSEYPKWCALNLIEAVNNQKEKKKIEKALRIFLPMIIGMGYSRDGIYYLCKQFFSQSNIDVNSGFSSFVNKFNGEEKEFVVYFAIEGTAKKFQSIMELRLGISFEDDDYSKNMHHKTGWIVVHREERAIDANRAANNAYAVFNVFMKFYRFLGNRNQEICDDRSLVVNKEGGSFRVPLKPNRFFVSKDYDDNTLGRKSESIISKLIENAEADLPDIEKLIQKHNAALSCEDINSTFLNLWSILEMVCVRSKTDSKIREILNSLVPVLKRNYFKNIIEELHDYIKGNISAEEYCNIVNCVMEDGNDYVKIAYLIVRPEYECARKELYRVLSSYPLIRSRVSQLNADIFMDKKCYYDELCRYEKRVSWHIQRLYRVRNSIIHSGESSSNIISLVEHLHSYVDELAYEIVFKLSDKNGLATIENVLMDDQVFVEKIGCEYRKGGEISNEDIAALLGYDVTRGKTTPRT